MSTDRRVESRDSAQAAIRGITSMATYHVLADLTAAWTQRSGQRVDLESAGGIDIARRVESGESFDFVVLAADVIDKLATAGRVDPASSVAVAQSGVAVAVRSGTPHPDIGSQDAVRDAVLAARMVGYSTGPSGRHLARLFDCWGIAEIIANRTVVAAPGVPVGGLLARGDVDLGFQQSSELVHVRGIDIVGMLPPEIQVITVFTAAVSPASDQKEATSALLRFLASSEGAATKRRHAMEVVGLR